MCLDNLIKEIYLNKNECNISSMENYMQNKFIFLGIKANTRREITKKYLKNLKKEEFSWEIFDLFWSQNEREFQYIALDYLKQMKKYLNNEDIPIIKKYIEDKSWWDTVDIFYSVIGSIGLKYDISNTMISWSKDRNIWVRRISIIHQNCRKDKTDIKLLENILLNNLNSNEFFINKAIGWAIRDYSKTNPNWAKNFIEKNINKLSKLSIKEGSKYL